MTTFSKDNTLALKGVAILFMVFAHLFNNMSLCELCDPLLYINHEPLVHYMIFAMNPVDFFIILSGYGLYIAYKGNKKNNTKRIKKLYLHYWVTLAIFVPIGYIVIGQEKYPGSITNIIYNLLAWKNDYNHETWFLLPYVLLASTSTIIFTVTDKISPATIFIVSFCIYLAVRLFSRFDANVIVTFQLYKWINSYFTLQFPFIIGMLMSRCWDFSVCKEKTIKRSGSNYRLVILLIVIFAGIILVRDKFQSIFYPFYAAAFIMCFSLLQRPRMIDKFLMEMGRRSTSVWFIHTYFCYYFFQNFIYSFKYPIIIYIVLMGISMVCAIIIDTINRNIQKVLIR